MKHSAWSNFVVPPILMLLAALVVPLLVACAATATSPPNPTPTREVGQPFPTAEPAPTATELPSEAAANTPAPPPPTSTVAATATLMPTMTPVATPTATPAPAPTAVVTDPVGEIVIMVLPDSVARYRIREQFARRNFPNDAVGETSDVTGTVVLNAQGVVQPDRSGISINVRTLRSDDDDRDDFLRDNALETDRFQTVEFVVAETPGLPWPLPENQEFQFQLQGSMTAHGVTRPVTWEMTAIRNGNNLTGQALTSFKFDKFDMERPSVFFLLSLEDKIQLELDLVASLSSGN